MIEKIKRYAEERGHKGKYLFSIRELAETGFLKPVKASTAVTIAQAIKNGELMAFVSIRNENNIYHIPVEAVVKWYKKREKDLARSPIPAWQKIYARKKKTRKGVEYLYNRGYKQIDIARCLGISRQRVNEIIK